MVAFGTVLAGLLMLAEQGGSSISSAKSVRPEYHRYEFESACGAFVFRVRFRNEPTGRSRVDHVLIDGRPVPGAAKKLDQFAARRSIDRIEIMNCGLNPQRPVFRGVMALSKPESQPANRKNMLFFRLVRRGNSWQFSVG